MKDYKLIEEKNSIIIRDLDDFDPKHIFECGQAFRWTVEEDQSYTAISRGKVINVRKEDKDIFFKHTNLEDFKKIWYNYFDLARDYGRIKEELSKDPILREATEFGQGLRILNQEPFETVISFIISANNQIPRIKKSIELISANYGQPIVQEGLKEGYYAFPRAKVLGQVDIDHLKEISRVGFRADRIIRSSAMIDRGEIDLDSIFTMTKDEGKEELMKLPGVGPKVSDCILLFAFNKDDAFPVDVWVKRVMEYFYLKKDTNVKYIGQEGARLFGSLAGFAQQYLFYYAREMAIGK